MSLLKGQDKVTVDVTMVGDGTSPNPLGVVWGATQTELLAQTTAISPVLQRNVSVDHMFRIGGYITITSIAVDIIQLQCVYTDETNTVRTQLFFPQGLTSASLATTGAFVFPTMDIRAKAGTNINVITVLTVGGGSITYDVGVTIDSLIAF